MNVEEVFAKVVGRQASEQERERLYRLREALGLRDNDAFWSIVMASGSTYSTTTTAALLGLTMAHPTTDAWPSTVTTQVDMDQDGKPGVTRDVPTGTQSNGVTYSGVEATANFRGSAIMGDAGTTVGIPRFRALRRKWG